MRHGVLRVLMVGGMALAAVAATVTPAGAAPWIGVWAQSTTSEVCAAVLVASEGAQATQEACADDAHQLWTFENVNTTEYRVRNNGTGKCLTTVGGSVVGTPITQNTCSTAFAQRWRLVGSGNIFRITSVANGNCVDRVNEAAGTVLVQGRCTLERTRWKLLY